MGVFLQSNTFLFWSMQLAPFTFTQVKKQTTGLLPEASEVMFRLCEIKGDCFGFLCPFLSLRCWRFSPGVGGGGYVSM